MYEAASRYNSILIGLAYTSPRHIVSLEVPRFETPLLAGLLLGSEYSS